MRACRAWDGAHKMWRPQGSNRNNNITACCLAPQGGTPGFLQPLLAFNALTSAWASAPGGPITARAMHAHIMALQRRFVAGLGGQDSVSSSEEAAGEEQQAGGQGAGADGCGAGAGAGATGCGMLLRKGQLVNWRPQAQACQSHTLVFDCGSNEQVGGQGPYALCSQRIQGSSFWLNRPACKL